MTMGSAKVWIGAACLLAVAACGPRPQPLAPELVARSGAREPEQRYVDLGSCALESGQTIEGCRVGYRTYGALDATKSNVVLWPTWFTGTTKSLHGSGLPLKLVDTSRYHLILVDALADGVSSAPSNSTSQPRLAFPAITIRDMVTSQKRLLDKLGITKPHAVMGISMGGMQALEWSVAYPEVPAKVISIVGTPQLSSHDLLLWNAELHALTGDVAYENGNYEGRPPLRALLDIHHMMLVTPEHRARETSRAAFPEWLSQQESDLGFDWNDWRRQLEAMLAHDVAKHDGGDLERAAKRVKAKTLVVVATQDHMVSPFTSRTWTTTVNSAQLIELDTPYNHFTPKYELPKLGSAVQSFLRD